VPAAARRNARAGAVVAAAALLVLLAGCGSSSFPYSGSNTRMSISSSAFHNKGPIPARYTCHGAGKRPPLRWSHVPKTANSLAIVVIDKDAVDPASNPAGKPYVHFVLTGLSPTATKLRSGTLPSGTKLGKNSSGKPGWKAPCPPAGAGAGAHHYEFTVYALKDPAKITRGMSPTDEVNAISGAGTEEATVVGTVTG
jgi:Raf kinase inhibitor-like YbhB/YbcL family protein